MPEGLGRLFHDVAGLLELTLAPAEEIARWRHLADAIGATPRELAELAAEPLPPLAAAPPAHAAELARLVVELLRAAHVAPAAPRPVRHAPRATPAELAPRSRGPPSRPRPRRPRRAGRRAQRRSAPHHGDSSTIKRLGKQHDWTMFIYERGATRGRATVITETVGDLAHHRIVLGREAECRRYYMLTTRLASLPSPG